MTLVHRVLFPHAIESLEEYLERGGGAGLEAAGGLEPEAIVAQIEASGLRGRGGAGFPTGRKWRTVAENRSPLEPAVVVVNGAEGEPSTFKDRAILRSDGGDLRYEPGPGGACFVVELWPAENSTIGVS